MCTSLLNVRSGFQKILDQVNADCLVGQPDVAEEEKGPRNALMAQLKLVSWPLPSFKTIKAELIEGLDGREAR
jgi:hypothetical protein